MSARLSESDDDIDNDDIVHQEEDHTNAPSSEPAMTLTTAQRQSIINKALTKIPSPGRFSGKDEKDKDNCENWCKQMTNYLNGLFRGITDAHAERMQICNDPI
jgi:hypothetical protein